MNCTELRRDIKKLENSVKSLKDQVTSGRESGKINVAFFEDSYEMMRANYDMIEKYLDDFKEKNPEAFAEKLSKIGEMDLGWERGVSPNVTVIKPMPDGEVWIGGTYGTLYSCNMNDGQWKLEHIGQFGQMNGVYSTVNDIAAMSDGGVLVGGPESLLYYYTKNDDGWEFSERIDGFMGDSNLNGHISVIASLPDGGVLIGGGDENGLNQSSSLYYCGRKNGRWELEPINGFCDAEGNFASVTNMVPTSDGGMIIGGDGGGSAVLCYCSRQNGQWKLEPIDGFMDCGGVDCSKRVTAMVAMPDGGVMIGGSTGALHYCAKKNGRWQLSNLNTNNQLGWVDAIAPLRGGGALVGGPEQLFYCDKENGEWRISERIGGVPEFFSMDRIIPMSSGGVLVGDRYDWYYCHRENGQWQFSEPIELPSPVAAITLAPNGDVIVGAKNVLHSFTRPTTMDAIMKIAKQSML